MNCEKKLKICHVITRMIVGGAQENTLFTVTGHLEKGHEVTLITGPSPGREGKLLQKVDCPAFRLVEIPSLVRELNPLQDMRAYFALRKFFKKEHFDVVHTHSSKAGIIGRMAAWDAKVPVVVHTVHGQAFHPYEKAWKNWIYKSAERFAAKRCHKIFSVAQAMIDQCVAAGVAPREQYKIVYSGMDIQPFLQSTPDLELKKSLGIPESARVIGSVARLFPLKGYEFFMPAAKEIARLYPDVHFLIVGDGTMHDQLLQEAEAHNLGGRFHFAGLIAPDQVYRYISIMDILYHLSLREGLPRSVVQALASGKPAIGFALDGTPEVIQNGKTGFCVAPESIYEVIQSTKTLLNDPALAKTMGKAGRALVAKPFDHHYMADQLEKEYLALCP